MVCFQSLWSSCSRPSSNWIHKNIVFTIGTLIRQHKKQIDFILGCRYEGQNKMVSLFYGYARVCPYRPNEFSLQGQIGIFVVAKESKF